MTPQVLPASRSIEESNATPKPCSQENLNVIQLHIGSEGHTFCQSEEGGCLYPEAGDWLMQKGLWGLSRMIHEGSESAVVHQGTWRSCFSLIELECFNSFEGLKPILGSRIFLHQVLVCSQTELGAGLKLHCFEHK